MRALLAGLVLALLARSAHANECNAYGPHMSAADVPLGCPAYVALPISELAAMPPYQPHVYTTRYDVHTGQQMMIDLTGTVTRDPDIQIPVETYTYHPGQGCDLVDDGPQPWPFALLEVTLQGAQVGDILQAGGYEQPHVVAAGPCPPFAAPALACAEPIQTCDRDGGIGDPVMPPGTGSGNDGGCNAGGAGGAGLTLLTLCVLGTSARRAARSRRAP